MKIHLPHHYIPLVCAGASHIWDKMKYLIVLTLATVASSARLDNVYLPPNSRGSSGANAGLQTPHGGATGPSASFKAQGHSGASQNYQASSQNAQNQAEILKYENEINDEGYHYAFETSDGTKAEQDGRVLPGATPEEGSIQVSGSYSYIGDDGQQYSITYTADENGFQPHGDHLPTPPPIPEAILKSLQLTAGNGAQYNSGKSSYDADIGY